MMNIGVAFCLMQVIPQSVDGSSRVAWSAAFNFVYSLYSSHDIHMAYVYDATYTLTLEGIKPILL